MATDASPRPKSAEVRGARVLVLVLKVNGLNRSARLADGEPRMRERRPNASALSTNNPRVNKTRKVNINFDFSFDPNHFGFLNLLIYNPPTNTIH